MAFLTIATAILFHLRKQWHALLLQALTSNALAELLMAKATKETGEQAAANAGQQTQRVIPC